MAKRRSLADLMFNIAFDMTKATGNLRVLGVKLQGQAMKVGAAISAAYGRRQVAQIDAITKAMKRQAAVQDIVAKGAARLQAQQARQASALAHRQQMNAAKGGGGGAGGGWGQAFAIGAATGGISLAIDAIAGGISRAVGGMQDLVGEGIEFNAQMEMMATGFEVMLGSEEKAKSMMDELQKYALKTPFGVTGLADTATQLLSTKKIAEDQLIPTIKKLGNAAAGSAKGFQSLPNITLAVSQMLAKGKVSAQDMRQLTEAGIPAWSALGEKVGKTTAELMKMSEAGELGEGAVRALIDAMGSRFGGMLEKQSKTFRGLWDQLKENIQVVLGKVTIPLFERMKKVMDRIVGIATSPEFTAWVDRIKEGVEAIAKKIEDWFTAIGGGANKAMQFFNFLKDNWKQVFDYAVKRAGYFALWLGDQFKYTLDIRVPTFLAAMWEGAIAGGREFTNQFQTMLKALIQFVADGLEAIFLSWKDRIKGIAEAGNMLRSMWTNPLSGVTPTSIVQKLSDASVGAQQKFAGRLGTAGASFATNMGAPLAAIGDKIGAAVKDVFRAMPGFKESPLTAGAGGVAKAAWDKLSAAFKATPLTDLFAFLKPPAAAEAEGGGLPDLFGGGALGEGKNAKTKKAGSQFLAIDELNKKIQTALTDKDAKDRKATATATRDTAKNTADLATLAKGSEARIAKELAPLIRKAAAFA